MRDVVALENPMSEEQSILRPTLLGSLLDTAQRNLSRGRDRVALFDSGTVYRSAPDAGRDDGLVDEHHGLGLLITGPVGPAGWGTSKPADAGFFAAKGLLGAVLDTLRVPWEATVQEWPFLHPGRSALVHSGERRLGFVGELHPLVARAWDLDVTAVFAIDLGVVAELAVPIARSSAEVVSAVKEAGGRLLTSVEVFDVYEGAQAGPGNKSIAMHLTFQAPDRTLTDQEAKELVDKILRTSLAKVGAALRA